MIILFVVGRKVSKNDPVVTLLNLNGSCIVIFNLFILLISVELPQKAK